VRDGAEASKLPGPAYGWPVRTARQRMECAQLAAAVARLAMLESASKLHALHMLREIRAS